MLMLLFTACGKTGALYLPEAEPAAAKAPVENSSLNKGAADSESF